MSFYLRTRRCPPTLTGRVPPGSHLNITIPKLKSSTLAVILGTAAISMLCVAGWILTGKTFLALGVNFIGFHGIGIGFLQGKIFWSSIITFSLAFAISFYLLSERQQLPSLAALLHSSLLVLSGAYLFEFVYLSLVQVLGKYVFSLGLWFNLLAGFAVALVFRRFKISKTPLILVAVFVTTMMVWYFGGYPQLNNKTNLVVLYHNYLGLPSDLSLYLNIVAKAAATLIPISLLGRSRIPFEISKTSRTVSWGISLLTLGSLFPILFVRLRDIGSGIFWLYSFCMTGFLIFMYVNTMRYKPIPDLGYRPFTSIVIPIKNEAAVIRQVIDTAFASDYPSANLEVIAVDDGSTDNTWSRLEQAKIIHGGKLVLVKHERNLGKRLALASGINRARGEIITCVDSDSFVDRDAIKNLVQPFNDKKVVAVCGHGEAKNKDEGVLPKLQHYWYAEMFRLMKGMESRFGCVTCCSGILAAYRRTAIMPVLREWLNERFAGRPILIGDDRQLTNLVARGSDRFKPKRSLGEDRILTIAALSTRDAKVVYQSNAVVHTIVPSTPKQFFKQQLRWKRAWVHGSLLGWRFMWKKPRPMAFTFYLYQFLTYMSPVVIIFWLFIKPLQGETLGTVGFLLGSLYIGLLHGLNSWRYISNLSIKGVLYRMVFVFLSIFISLTVLLYGWLTPWKGGWVTRTERIPMKTQPTAPLLTAEA